MTRAPALALATLGVAAVLIGALAGCGSGSASEARADGVRRLVVVGGAVTETVFALGGGDDVVAVDTSSVFPEAAAALPKVGYQRALSAEGVLSLRPTLVLAAHEAGPPAAIAQLREAGVKVVMIGGDASLAGARERVRQVAAALGRVDEGEALVTRMAREAEVTAALVARARTRPRVLFVYARGSGSAQVSGTGTAATEMIALAGGENAVSTFSGFKPLTAEAVAQAAPDVILVPARGLASLGGIDGLLGQPGVALTPAGRNRRVVAIDDLLLLGFGPRTAEGVRALATVLHAELVEPSR